MNIQQCNLHYITSILEPPPPPFFKGSQCLDPIKYSFWLWLTSVSWAGADCGSDHELLIAKFRLKLKKVGKTTRPFRYDLNQIPYDHTVEMTKRFKGLDLIDRVPEELWMEVNDTAQEAVIKTIPKKKKCKKTKWLSENGCLQIAEKRREAKGKGEKERYTHLNAEFQRITTRDEKAFLSDQCKKIKTTEWERLEISSRKLEVPMEHFLQRWA